MTSEPPGGHRAPGDGRDGEPDERRPPADGRRGSDEAPGSPRPRRRLLVLAAVPLVAAVALVVVLVVAALGRPAEGRAAPGTEAASATPTAASPTAAAPGTGTPPGATASPAPTPEGGPSEPAAPGPVSPPADGGEPPPGWDQQPDAAPVPDADLSVAEVDALLRAVATGPVETTTCAADAVSYELTGFDAAAGHRYATLVVRTTVDAPCTVSGYLGLGGRGTWGGALRLEVEQRPVIGEGDATPVVELAPGEAATATLEWTGELAGAGAERLSSLALQLARGQHATLHAVAGPGGDPLDIGMLTTVRIGPLRPAG